MVSNLQLVDQVWMFSLTFAFIVGCLAILVLHGPGFVREVARDLRELFARDVHEGPGPTDLDVRPLLPGDVIYIPPDVLALDAEIQELQ